VNDLVECAAGLGVGTGRLPSVPIDIQFDERTRLVGSIPMALVAGGPGSACVTFSKEKPSQRVRAWLDLMVLSVARSDTEWRSVVVCRNRRKDSPAVASDYRLAPPAKDPPPPRECLDLALTLYRLGMAEPVPLFPKLSDALCFRPRSNMASIWRSSPGSPGGPGEGESETAELVYGRCDVEAVLSQPSRSEDPGQGPRSSRARLLARALYPTVASSMRARTDKAEAEGDATTATPSGGRR
jgi:exonuclease V gamma subunit